MLAIRLMRMGAKKSPSYDGAYVENLGFYNPTRNPAEVRLNMERVDYWIERGAQPTDTVRQLIRQQRRLAAAETAPAGA
jgi:small subunit ribosomal protein S16